MNKLAFLALFALVGCVAAEDLFADEEFSQALIPSMDDETKYLTGDNTVFADFCLFARDESNKFIKNSANQIAANVFKVLFSSAAEIGDEVLSVKSSAVEEGAEMIRTANLDQSVEKADETSVKQKLSLLNVVSQAVRVVINSIIQAANREFFDRVERLKSVYETENIRNVISESCKKLSLDLMSRLDCELGKVKSQLRKQASTKPSLVDVATKVTVGNAGCVTAGRVAKMSTFCDVLRMAGSTIYPLFGL